MATLTFSKCDNHESSIRRIETNTRTYDRNIPSSVLQPYLDVRPVSTKYSYMPIVDPRKKINTQLNIMPVYNPAKTFNPGNDMGPWSGYATGVNVESDLRNQFFAIQKCPQSYYVPSSNSDLYEYKFQNNPVQINQPFPGLFKESEIGKDNYSETFNSPENNFLFYSSSRILGVDSRKNNPIGC